MKIGIIGSGLVGLDAAWRLQRSGHEVTAFDANAETREASWAAAGMLAPHHEALKPDGFWAFCSEGLQRWKTYAGELRVSPDELDLHFASGWIPFFSNEEAEALRIKAQWLKEQGVEVAYHDEPKEDHLKAGMNPSVLGVAQWTGGFVDPRRLALCLRSLGRNDGVNLRFGSKVETMDDRGNVVVGGEEEHFDHVVLAAGAWTPGLAELTGLELKGAPVRGQMIRFGPSHGVNLSHFVHSEMGYVVPRADGRLVVGSTMEDAGFDRSDNLESIAALRDNIRELFPPLAHVEVEESWTGLRPRLDGGRPHFERVGEALTVATGHFRNGVLLAPLSGSIVQELVEGTEGLGMKALKHLSQ